MRRTIEINWSLSDCVTSTWSPFGHRLLAVRVDRAWAVNQNRNARWADSEERLFGLTPDLGQGVRLTLAVVR